MQSFFLERAQSALHIITPGTQYRLNSSTEHTTRKHATRCHGLSMYNSFLCVLPGSHFTAEWTGAHFGYKSCPGTLGTED